MRRPLLLPIAALAVAALACASTQPMLSSVPPGEPLPIDGVWRERTAKARFQIGAGRVWALDPFLSGGLWQVRPEQVEVVDLKRTGPRKFAGWHPGYDGPYHIHLVAEDRAAVLLRTRLFGDYTSMLDRISVDDEAALAEELRGPAPGAPWLDAELVAAATPAAPGASAAQPPAALDAPAGTDFGRYHALLIGNDGYRQLPKLRSAGADAREVARLLREKYGFETTVLEDATRQQVLLALERYRRELTDRDNLLVYYAGHGWLDEEADEGYWLPVDASPDSAVQWIPIATLSASFKAIRAKHVLVVADSCYSGKLTRGIAVRANRPPDYVERMIRKRARMVIASGGLEPVLDGGRGDHSVFAGAFLEALRVNDGVLDTTSLFARIRRDVMLHADQTPELADIRKSGHEGGDFLFVPRE